MTIFFDIAELHRLHSEARDLLLSLAGPCFVYIISSKSRVLYTGVTNNLERRISQHKHGLVPGFTKHYRIHRLGDVRAAVESEKQIKGWARRKKVGLIEAANPTWADLAEALARDKKKQMPRSEARTSHT